MRLWKNEVMDVSHAATFWRKVLGIGEDDGSGLNDGIMNGSILLAGEGLSVRGAGEGITGTFDVGGMVGFAAGLAGGLGVGVVGAGVAGAGVAALQSLTVKVLSALFLPLLTQA